MSWPGQHLRPLPALARKSLDGREVVTQNDKCHGRALGENPWRD
jgi:hypothetical protein